MKDIYQNTTLFLDELKWIIAESPKKEPKTTKLKLPVSVVRPENPFLQDEFENIMKLKSWLKSFDWEWNEKYLAILCT